MRIAGDQADRQRAGAAGAQEYQRGDRDQRERQREGERHRASTTSSGSAQKWLGDAVHGGDREHEHGEHAEAVDALALRLDPGAPGDAADRRRGEGPSRR